ncbi:histone deacetylase [Wenzhouxiangella sp. AB-CW3]|uniref:histone deacetylase family protein n=1 Tax=Wenzhouxiangella sp. AB-CW3 TaxID=2771012 RepID=UPI00168B2A8B|nr:histone deacetylase [Wenzhouxiangella sp. AB-CW3]QOC22379.1 histone deacetylase [Wenzhouxiangella sp. AB-CW3]
MAARLALVYHDEMLAHRPPGLEPEIRDYHARKLRALLGPLVAESPWKHPERPERLSALVEYLRGVTDERIAWIEPERADAETILRAHTPVHLRRLEALRGRSRMLSIDTTAVSPGSVDAATRAAGAAVEAVNAVCDGRAETAFALVRPPGHHAFAATYRGFCLVNNVAVAARHARAVHGMDRVLIVDWDIHHGDGTESIFAADPSVLFFDVHRSAPFYPGSGPLEFIGRGRGKGTTLNVPLPAGAGDRAVLAAFDEILLPAAQTFRPELILVSAGFDGTREHLACRFSPAVYAHLTRRLQDLAETHAQGRLAMVLEGGYHINPMRQALEQCIHVLLDPDADLPSIKPTRTGLPAVRRARDHFARTVPGLAR